MALEPSMVPEPNNIAHAGQDANAQPPSWPHASLALSSAEQGMALKHNAETERVERVDIQAVSPSDSAQSDEKPWFKAKKEAQNNVQPRAWRTSFIRFGPISGICGMLLAIMSLIASLGILAGSNNQPVANWTTPPSTYLAIFTALANLSIRYAAIQGVIIAWWYRALRGSTIGKLHWDWYAGTTLRGAIASGRHMGLLGLACIFSIIVVIGESQTRNEGSGMKTDYIIRTAIKMRASTVHLAPIVDQSTPLSLSIAPQIPHNFSGSWNHWFGPMQAFNETVPSIHGPVGNSIEAYPNQLITREVTEAWYSDAPLTGVVRGCSDKSCKATIHAPALFPTCEVRSIAIDGNRPWDWEKSLKTPTAPPHYALAFTIGMQIIVKDDKEWINVVVGSSDAGPTNCIGTLSFTICELQSAIGAYDVEIKDNEIQMRTLRPPRLVALSNNTEVSPTDEKNHDGYFPSTLGGVAYMGWQRWQSLLYRYTQGNQSYSIFSSVVPWTLIVKPETSKATCASYRNMTDEVLMSLNKFVVYLGASAANSKVNPKKLQMDPGLSMKTNVTGEVVGQESKYNTDYWFFFAAALVEVVCIVLILPTYYGWWKIGRPVSLSPLEVGKAFEAPMLADCHSNSRGRQMANAMANMPVQYGATDQDRRLAFSNPTRVTIPQTALGL